MKTIIGSVVAAVAASACCLGPVALTAMGAGALGVATVKLEPLRPLFLAVTAALLGAGFFVTYRRSSPEQCAANGSCAPSSKRTAKIVLWLATIAVTLLVGFPYYASRLVGNEVTSSLNVAANAAPAQDANSTVVCTLSVTGMSCPGCATAVRNAAVAVDGVKGATVTYEEGLAHVTYDPAKTNPTAIAAAVEEETGYKARTQVSPRSK